MRKKRISLTMPDSIYSVLTRIADDKNVTLTEVIRHAIGLENWFHEANKVGDKIMVKRGSEWKEVLFDKALKQLNY